ncbi:VCBS repeat-containing protein [Maribacter sp. LLG6340-A2]|uniref:VCBS repeat-containing protein n=1 Tax=Maribacter sp. LLG6340-A2 TaxID=3160834 RepID=UPI003863D49E
MTTKQFTFLFTCILLMIGCNEKAKDIPVNNTDPIEKTTPLFTLLTPEQTNISFENTLNEGLNANVLVYEYLYNGGGIAAGDFNDDGLEDLYFSSNMGDNKLYLNQGGLKFEDVTSIAKVNGRSGPWKTGVSSADVNGDGKLDIYLCYSGALPDHKRKNQLFINQGNDENNVPIFKEEAAKYGLDSAAFSNQGYFFDYDKDGDLDMVLLNHNPKSLPVLNEVSTKQFLKKDDPLQGSRLYEQKNGRFIDVTVSAGISGSALSYGLGIGIGDINNDGWQDFYISNDYTIPDYLYINNKNGTFTDQLGKQMGHTSHFSMGNNITDINNDGWQDIFTLDMLPEDNKRQKLLLSPDNYEKFDLNIRSGFHHQYMRNMLQLNNGNSTFSEVGQLTGISNTDWSWAPLFADFNNDGYKDLYITNGYYRDYTNLDFINYMEDFVQSKGRLQRQDVLELIKKMPSSNLTNYYYTNVNGSTFIDQTQKLGIDDPANSNGAIYSDLDNDGDLDLIVNNINKPAFIYRNNNDSLTNRYLKIKLKGAEKNTAGIGAKATVYAQSQMQVLEQMPTQGYLSTITPTLHFGMNDIKVIDSISINWNSGKQEVFTNVKTNQTLLIDEVNANRKAPTNNQLKPLFTKLESPINFEHTSTGFNDFKRQSLLLKQFSHKSPAIVKADINNDNLEDIIIGGGIGQSASVYLQTPKNTFNKHPVNDFIKDADHLDTDIAIFDANGDGFLDIYIASGGYHDLQQNDQRLQDRLYVGDGKGNFKRVRSALPNMLTNTGSVSFSDINNDSYLDLFVGGSYIPGRYPETSRSYILMNNGKGEFNDQTLKIQPGLQLPGAITDSEWADINGDSIDDLITVGEWLPIQIFINKKGTLVDDTSTYFNQLPKGLWTTLELADVDKDGRIDILAGNVGLNTQFNVTSDTPAELYYSDFDKNGSIDPILNFYVGDSSYPYITRDELLGQLAGLRQRFTSYETYANAQLTDIFSKAQLEKASKLTMDHQETTLFLNLGNKKLKQVILPLQAQYAPTSQIIVKDFNHDGHLDVLVLGNDEFYKLRIGKFDANYGTMLYGDGKGQFKYIPQSVSGLTIVGSEPKAVMINGQLMVVTYGKNIQTYKFSE